MLGITGARKSKLRDIQIQVSLDAILGKHTKELGEQAIQYLVKELPVKEYDVAKTFETLTVWLVAKMIERPHPFYQVQIQWGRTENVNYVPLIGEKNKVLGWDHFSLDFSKETDHTRVTKIMVMRSHMMIKELRRYGFLQ